jgi:hypothetical protein
MAEDVYAWHDIAARIDQRQPSIYVWRGDVVCTREKAIDHVVRWTFWTSAAREARAHHGLNPWETLTLLDNWRRDVQVYAYVYVTGSGNWIAP